MKLPSLTPASRVHTEGPGFVAIVFDGVEEDAVAFDSFVAHLKAGVFKTAEAAEAYARTWKDGRLAQLSRVLHLQVERGLALGPRTMEISRAITSIEAHKKELTAEITSLKAEHLRLAAEATSPRVDLVCTPASGWQIFDGKADPQLALKMEEPKDPSELVEEMLEAGKAKRTPKEAGAVPRLPLSVPGRDGKRLRAGSLVTVHEFNDMTWLAEVERVSRQDDAGAYVLEVIDSAGIPHDVEAQRCVKARRADHPTWVGRAPANDEPEAPPSDTPAAEPPAEPRPGIDPKSIRWPDDEQPSEGAAE
jgi:hypothetical protein